MAGAGVGPDLVGVLPADGRGFEAGETIVGGVVVAGPNT